MINPIRETDRRRDLQTKLDNNRPNFERWLQQSISNDLQPPVPDDIAIPTPFLLNISSENLLLLAQEKLNEPEATIPYKDEFEDDENQYVFSFIQDMDHFSANI